MKKSKKAPNGSGTIRQRSDGRWEGRYSYTDPRTGKDRRKSIYGKTKSEAAAKLRKITAEVDQGNFVPDSNVTLTQWSETYLKDYLSPQSADGTKSNGTEKSYRGILYNHVLPVLGKKRLKDITSLDIQRLLTNLESKSNSNTKKPLTAKTILNVHGVIHAVLEQAVCLDMLKKNPADKKKLKLPKNKKKNPRSLTLDEYHRLKASIEGHRYELVYRFDLLSGLREGEILGLTWDCVDWEKSAILVKHQVAYMGKGRGYSFVETKNHTDRVVIVSEEAMELLRQQKERQEAAQALAGSAWDNPRNSVFSNELGEYLKPCAVYRGLKKILVELGMGDVTFHSLRHSYATFAIRAGNSVKTVQANMGHHSAAFTIDTYVSDQCDGKRAEAEEMSKHLQKQPSGL